MTSWTLILLFFGAGLSPSFSSSTVAGFLDVDACVVAGEKVQKMLDDRKITRIRYACVQIK